MEKDDLIRSATLIDVHISSLDVDPNLGLESSMLNWDSSKVNPSELTDFASECDSVCLPSSFPLK